MVMPELPEVETVCSQLREVLQGKVVTKVEPFDSKVIDPQIPLNVPFSVTSVGRRGKWILVNLQHKQHLLIHLRMTGNFAYNPATKQKYMKAIFHLEDGSKLIHNSIRRFGGIKLLNTRQLQQKMSKIGPDPFDISAAEFSSLIRGYPRSNIKNKLLDQTFLAGVGNIYAQEALYAAKIGPLRRIGDVPNKKLETLHRELLTILTLSIQNNGTSVSDYTHMDGKGDFQNLLSVYGKKVCPKSHQLQKIKVGGRGTYYCPRCQK
jgi:formamidopyrimidine-DNA glycosylase